MVLWSENNIEVNTVCFFYVYFKIPTKSGAQIGDFRMGGCHPLLKIDVWHATRSTRSNEGPEISVLIRSFINIIIYFRIQKWKYSSCQQNRKTPICQIQLLISRPVDYPRMKNTIRLTIMKFLYLLDCSGCSNLIPFLAPGRHVAQFQ